MSDDVAFIDTETLGLDPDVNPIWEVGLILPDGTEREWQLRVTQREISLAHPVALEITHFHDRYGVSRALDTSEDFCYDLLKAIPEGCHLAGAVPSFDEERLRRLMWKHGYSPRWHYHLVDVEALVAGKLGIVPPWNSNDLSRAIGVDPDNFHTHEALADARWAKALYDAVFAAPTKDSPVETERAP